MISSDHQFKCLKTLDNLSIKHEISNRRAHTQTCLWRCRCPSAGMSAELLMRLRAMKQQQTDMTKSGMMQKMRREAVEWIFGCSFPAWGQGAQVTNVSLVWLVVKACRSEKTASGIARVAEKSQIAAARRQTPSPAPDLWMSSGLTMALYLNSEK